MNDTDEIVGVLMFGLLAGMLIIAVADGVIDSEEEALWVQRNTLIEECQQTLPRNQVCKVELVAAPWPMP